MRESYHHFMGALWFVIGLFTLTSTAMSLAFGMISVTGTLASLGGFVMLMSMLWTIYHIQQAGVSRRVE